MKRVSQDPEMLIRQWPSKVFAGLLLGAPLSLGVLGDLGLLLHVSRQLDQPEALLLRWVPGAVWVLSFCWALALRSGLRAWGGLLLGNALIWGLYGILYILRVAGWAAL
ncbi:hypothetical protein AA106555_0045 [Neokomagataea thailandica NBRC 106555]|nr:hypothetical protein [Neokomagataea thailandica]GBR49980.1 hypothetical protein AA106555_0045 [Neokomagataea thailandica NBRC 106555]